MKAVIRDFRPDPKNPKVVATVTVGPGEMLAVVSTDRKGLRESLITEGIVGEMGKHYKVEDGELFVQQLPFHFKSPYLRAEVIPE